MTWQEPELFPGIPHNVAPPMETLSPDRRRTIRNQALLDGGTHPLTRVALRPDLGTCGDCAYHVEVRHNRTWHKCEWRMTSGPGTDIRVSWPACAKFVAAEVPS